MAPRQPFETVTNTENLITPFEEIANCKDPGKAEEQARKWTRLTLYAINGFLMDYDDSILEQDDVRLVQEVAFTADQWQRAAGGLRHDHDATHTPTRKRGHRRPRLAAVPPTSAPDRSA